MAEHLHDVERAASLDDADPELGVAGEDDLVPVGPGGHEGVVQAGDVGALAHVLAHDLPPLDLLGERGVVVGRSSCGHALGVAAGDDDEVVGNHQRAETPG